MVIEMYQQEEEVEIKVKVKAEKEWDVDMDMEEMAVLHEAMRTEIPRVEVEI